MPEMSDLERGGVEAVIWLQKLGGTTETEESALKVWRSLSPTNQAITLVAYEQLHSVIGDPEEGDDNPS